jgi:hypothetical protein
MFEVGSKRLFATTVGDFHHSVIHLNADLRIELDGGVRGCGWLVMRRLVFLASHQGADRKTDAR